LVAYQGTINPSQGIVLVAKIEFRGKDLGKDAKNKTGEVAGGTGSAAAVLVA